MTGATILCAESALRTGVGSVKLLCTKETFSFFSNAIPGAVPNWLKRTLQLFGTNA